jgi:hypothetical protein
MYKRELAELVMAMKEGGLFSFGKYLILSFSYWKVHYDPHDEM